ncbi:MAG: ABC transporter permease, partial [Verrucomicrobia bacterium]|nr:ABC transporter permease [Verrucomicrobiota bacterium]
MTRFLRVIGRKSLTLLTGLGDFANFVVRAFVAVAHARQLRKGVARAIHQQGIRCLLVVTVVALFSGLVLGLQGYYVLSRFGSAGLLGTLVSLTLTRELAPVLATLMIIGQAGSAIAAEIGIYRYSEQIDALTTMAIDPLGYLISPQFLAALLVFPILTVAFVLVGIFGGYLS